MVLVDWAIFLSKRRKLHSMLEVLHTCSHLHGGKAGMISKHSARPKQNFCALSTRVIS